MKILLNGEVQHLATQCAVAVNAKAIPRDKFAHTPLHEGDELLVIHPTFGG